MEYQILTFLILLLGLVSGRRRLMEDDNLFEGDIELTREQKLEAALSFNGKPSFGATTSGIWPKTIPYKIDATLVNETKAVWAIAQAIAHFEQNTCLNFRPKTDLDKAYINFGTGSGCSSPVGYRRNNVNKIRLKRGCWSRGIVVHEIMHSLGFTHEQNRPDRDQFVKILWANIAQGKAANFRKYSQNRINSFGSQYDYLSVMHYSTKAFGNGKQTIELLNTKLKPRQVGHKKGLSQQDIIQLKKKYNC